MILFILLILIIFRREELGDAGVKGTLFPACIWFNCTICDEGVPQCGHTQNIQENGNKF